jgi:hypothetical protein
MEHMTTFIIVVSIVAYFLFLFLLAVARSIFGAAEVDFSRLLASSLYITIAVIAVGVALYFLIVSWILSHGDPGPGGFLLVLLYGILPFTAATFLVVLLVLQPAPVKRMQRLAISVFTAVLFPRLYLGLAWGYHIVTPKISHHVAGIRREALTVRGEEAQLLIQQYGLPHVDGASLRQFTRSAAGKQTYFTAFYPAPNYGGSTSVTWREWTEQVAEQVEAGLKQSGYQVVRSAGRSQKYWAREGTFELAPIIIEGTRNGAFARYEIDYKPTEGAITAPCLLNFGEQ